MGTYNASVTIAPNETRVVNFAYVAPSKLGIYWIDNSLIDLNGNLTQVTYEAEKFAVSLENTFSKLAKGLSI